MKPAIHRRPLRSALLLCMLWLGIATPATADVVVICNEADFNALVAMGGGPHQLRFCSSGAIFPLMFTSTKVILTPLVLETAEPMAPFLLFQSSSGSSPLFHVPAGSSLSLRDFELHGNSTPGSGRAILNEGTLEIFDSKLYGGSSSGNGGSIANFGIATLSGTTITGATAIGGGGAIYNTGQLTLIESSLVDSSATGRGGAILNVGGSVTLERSSIHGSSVAAGPGGESDGGAIHSDGTLVVSQSTLSTNSVARHGGAIFLEGGSAIVEASTIANNTAATGGAVLAGTGSIETGRSILQGDCLVPAGSVGDNLESPGATCSLGGIGDQSSVSSTSLGLGTLRFNGGPTKTHQLSPGSVAIDAVELASCLPGDQRGAPRPDSKDGVACDVGAYEWTKVELGNPRAIVTKGDPDPRGGPTIERFEGVATTNGAVAFVAFDSSGDHGIYLHDGSALRHVAGSATPVPGTAEYFSFDEATDGYGSSMWSMKARGGRFALFYRGSARPCVRCEWPTSRGFYVFGSSLPLTRCAGVGDTIPGEIWPIGFQAAPAYDVGVNGVTFSGGAVNECNESGITTIFPSTMVLPDGSELTLRARGALVNEDGVVLFVGDHLIRVPPQGPTLSSGAGVYEFDPVSDTTTLILPANPNHSFEHALHRFASVTYIASAIQSFKLGGLFPTEYGGLWDDTSGSFELRERFATLVGPSLEFVGGVAYSASGPVQDLFHGPPISNCYPIWSNLGGVSEPLIDMGDTFDGKIVTCLNAGPDFVDETQIAFIAQFDDASSAIYVATVPEPSATVGMLSALFVLVGLARRRSRSVGANR